MEEYKGSMTGSILTGEHMYTRQDAKIARILSIKEIINGILTTGVAQSQPGRIKFM